MLLYVYLFYIHLLQWEVYGDDVEGAIYTNYTCIVMYNCLINILWLNSRTLIAKNNMYIYTNV